MKRILISVAFGLVLIGVAILFRHRTNNAQEPSQPARENTEPHPSIASGKSSTPSARERDQKQIEERIAAIQADPSNEWKAPISFFGRVVDEDNKPIAGASIAFSWNDTSAKGTSHHSTTSDGDGRFELTGRTGKGLSVDVTGINGYPFTNGARNSFEFGDPWVPNHIPDKNNPVVFRWKKQGKIEPLIAWRALLGVDNNGPERGFQFVPALITDPGDFRFSCKVGTAEDGRRRFDWEFKMSIPGGGLLATDEEFPFLAPEDGYTESVTWTAKIEDEQWQGVKRQMFYIRYGNPVRYGRLHVTFDGSTPRFYTRSGVILSWWINPTGSRVVESGKGEPPTIPEASLRSRTPWTGGL